MWQKYRQTEFGLCSHLCRKIIHHSPATYQKLAGLVCGMELCTKLTRGPITAAGEGKSKASWFLFHTVMLNRNNGFESRICISTNALESPSGISCRQCMGKCKLMGICSPVTGEVGRERSIKRQDVFPVVKREITNSLTSHHSRSYQRRWGFSPELKPTRKFPNPSFLAVSLDTSYCHEIMLDCNLGLSTTSAIHVCCRALTCRQVPPVARKKKV